MFMIATKEFPLLGLDCRDRRMPIESRPQTIADSRDMPILLLLKQRHDPCFEPLVLAIHNCL